jgi:hypothetical protein
VKDVGPHGHLVEADFHVEAVFAAVDHVSDLLSCVIPGPSLRVDTTDVGNVLPRAMRVRFRDTRGLRRREAAHLEREGALDHGGPQRRKMIVTQFLIPLPSCVAFDGLGRARSIRLTVSMRSLAREQAVADNFEILMERRVRRRPFHERLDLSIHSRAIKNIDLCRRDRSHQVFRRNDLCFSRK